MNIKKIVAGGLAAGALSAGLGMVVTAAPASARTCSEVVEAINEGGDGPTTGEKWACASQIQGNKWATFGPNLVDKWTGFPDRLAKKWTSWPGFPDPEESTTTQKSGGPAPVSADPPAGDPGSEGGEG